MKRKRIIAALLTGTMLCSSIMEQSDGSVGLVHKFIWKGDAMEGDWYMDGKKTSGNMYETYYKKYHANATWYSFAQSSNNNLIRKELSNTKQKLGM